MSDINASMTTIKKNFDNGKDRGILGLKGAHGGEGTLDKCRRYFRKMATAPHPARSIAERQTSRITIARIAAVQYSHGVNLRMGVPKAQAYSARHCIGHSKRDCEGIIGECLLDEPDGKCKR